MNNIISIETSNQIDSLNLNFDQPLIISDADEVIFLFLKGFEKFLKSKNLYLDLTKARLTGNIKKISDNDLMEIGPIIENHKYFPDRVNVTFADIQDKKNIKVNVWERGAGNTLACGTAACATAFIASQTGKVENQVNIHFKRGHLIIEIQPDKNILMTGPVSEPKKIEVNLND